MCIYLAFLCHWVFILPKTEHFKEMETAPWLFSPAANVLSILKGLVLFIFQSYPYHIILCKAAIMCFLISSSRPKERIQLSWCLEHSKSSINTCWNDDSRNSRIYAKESQGLKKKSVSLTFYSFSGFPHVNRICKYNQRLFYLFVHFHQKKTFFPYWQLKWPGRK